MANPTFRDRLANDVSSAAASYQVVVIGSGYGGSVSALRWAEAGYEVAVLERGIEILPGEFPDSLRSAAANFQFSTGNSGRSLGDQQNLFDLRVQKDLSVMVGCGLGGTSLSNGNVMLEPEAAVFRDDVWPQDLRISTRNLETGEGLAELTQRGVLRAAFDRARQMLGAKPLPTEYEFAKLDALATQATALGGVVHRPALTITCNTHGEPNYAGVVQADCVFCGDCCSGCNVGAKNTLAMNYLPAAAKHGALLFTGAKVLWLERDAAGWNIHYYHFESGQTRTIAAERIVLSAGTLGSTEILLRSRDNGLLLSERVGESVSGNGDVIAFGYNNDQVINGVGVGVQTPMKRKPVGPVITGLIDLRLSKTLTQNIVVQEGALPSLLAPLLPAMLSGASPLFGDDMDTDDTWEELKRTIKSLLGGAYRGAVNRTQTYLVMGHESSKGVMHLQDDRLALRWPDAGQDEVFDFINKQLAKATAATGGTLIPNPMWSKRLGRNLISVHPLGGCSLGDNVVSGVVNSLGQAFNPAGGVYDTLQVLDGSILPRSLGVNPALTIAALAERATEILLTKVAEPAKYT